MKRAAWFVPALAGVLAFTAAIPATAENSDDAGGAGIPAYSVARIIVSEGSAWVRTSGELLLPAAIGGDPVRPPCG